MNIPSPQIVYIPVVLQLFSLTETPAYACATCGFGDDPSRSAYLLTTGLMTAIPLIAVGLVLTWVLKQLKKSDLEDKPSDQEA